MTIRTNELAAKSATLLSIFPSSANITYLQWYDRWLHAQLENVPPSIIKRDTSFPTVFLKIANSAKTAASIDGIAMNLLGLDLLKVQDGDDETQMTRTLVFAVLGWQTMLYKPAFGVCPPQQLAIADILNGYTGQAFMTLKQDQSRINSCLPDFLLGFGLMQDRQAFEKIAIVSPGGFNAALLQSVARINIKWVDVMAPHLEFDKATNTLFLFRYPSFCMANIPLEDDSRG